MVNVCSSGNLPILWVLINNLVTGEWWCVYLLACYSLIFTLMQIQRYCIVHGSAFSNQTTIVYSSLPIYPSIPPVPNHGIKTMDIWISIHLTFQHSLQLYNEMKKIFLERLSNCLFNFYILKTNWVDVSLFSMMIFERLIHPGPCIHLICSVILIIIFFIWFSKSNFLHELKPTL